MSGHVYRYGVLAGDRNGRQTAQCGNASRYCNLERVEGRHETSIGLANAAIVCAERTVEFGTVPDLFRMLI
jgi:hypothetical protein